MMTFDTTTERFRSLVEKGILPEERLKSAEEAAAARGAELETVLVREFGVPKLALLQALADHYHCPFVEYDEKMPIAPELLTSLDNEKLTYSRWFPVIRDGETVVIAANDPANPAVLEEARRMVPAVRYEVWVALAEDIQWYIQDYLHARPGLLIGTERTGYAFWRNTMALWRTRLACYRTDLALARTNLALLRWGLGCIALGDGLLRAGVTTSVPLSAALFTVGVGLGALGLQGYLRVRRSRLGPPGHTTVVEVTAATVAFLERFHDIEGAERRHIDQEDNAGKDRRSSGRPLHDPHAAAGKQGAHPPCAGAERAGRSADDRCRIPDALRPRQDRSCLYPHRCFLHRSRHRSGAVFRAKPLHHARCRPDHGRAVHGDRRLAVVLPGAA